MLPQQCLLMSWQHQCRICSNVKCCCKRPSYAVQHWIEDLQAYTPRRLMALWHTGAAAQALGWLRLCAAVSALLFGRILDAGVEKAVSRCEITCVEPTFNSCVRLHQHAALGCHSGDMAAGQAIALW